MAVYKIFPQADATIYSRYPVKNTGRDPVLEVSVKNSQDSLRFINRSLLTQSPYYNYDLAADDNPSSTVPTPPNTDIRRSLLQFSDQDLQILKTFASQSVSGSWDAYLRLGLAFAQNLNQEYTIEAYPVSHSWVMGTGKYANVPEVRNGVSWYFTGPYYTSQSWAIDTFYWDNVLLGTWDGAISSATRWQQGITGSVNGGSWYSQYGVSQSFDYMSNKDINMKITSIADLWFSGSIENSGIILKHRDYLETDENTFIDLKFFSVDTHTIYPPCIELRWDDSHYYPIGAKYVLTDEISLTLANNPGTYKKDSVYKFRTAVRNTYPARQFTTSSVYLNQLYLSRESYWAIQDAKTGEMVVDFDDNYTKLSADSLSNYFYVYMNGLEIERYYKILIKTKIYATTFGPLSIYDNEQSIYDALSLYAAEDLALLPGEVIIKDTNTIFKIVA